MALLVCLVVAPEGEGLGTERAGDGALVADALSVLVVGHLGPRHPAHVAAVTAELVWGMTVRQGLGRRLAKPTLADTYVWLC